MRRGLGARCSEGPKLPTRPEQIKAAGGIKARLALCLSRATLLAPDEVVYRRPTPSTRLTPSSRLATLLAQASAIQLLRDRFAAYPEVRSFLAAYDEPHRTVQDKVAALLTPTRHHVISRAQHARVTKGGGLAALVTTALEARNRRPWSRTNVRTRRPRAGVPQARRRRGPREARLQGPEPGPERPRRARPRHQGHGLRPYIDATHRLSRRSSPRSARPTSFLLLPRVSFPLSPQRS